MPVRFQLDDLTVDTARVEPPWAPAVTITWRVTTFDEGEPSFLMLAADPGDEIAIGFEGSMTVTPSVRTTYRIIGHWNGGHTDVGAVTIDVGEAVTVDLRNGRGGGQTDFARRGLAGAGDLFVLPLFVTTGYLRRRGDVVDIRGGEARVRYRLLHFIGMSYEPDAQAQTSLALSLEDGQFVATRGDRPVELEIATVSVGPHGGNVINGVPVTPEMIARAQAFVDNREIHQRLLASSIDLSIADVVAYVNGMHVSSEYFFNSLDTRGEAVLAKCLRGHWVQPPGDRRARDVGVGPDGAVWVVGEDDSVHRLAGDRWERSTVEGAARIAVGPTGPWIVDREGRVLRLGPEGWAEVGAPETASDIGVGADGEAWIVRPNEAVARLNGDAWEDTDGRAVRVSVRPDGIPVVSNSEGRIFRLEGTWIEDELDGRARDVGVGSDGTLWVIGSDGGTYRRLPTRWERVPGIATNISVAPDGAPWITDAAHDILRREYAP